MDLSLPLSQLAVTQCGFRGCINELPKDAPFKLCEVCRVLYVTERLTLLTDPFSSRPDNVKDTLLNQQITAQTAAEVLQTRDNLQYLYLEYCKVIKLYGIEPANKRAKLTLEEQIEEARAGNRNVETRSKANVSKVKESLNKLEKQMKALGCKDPKGTKGLCPDCIHKSEAQRIFNDVAPTGELDF